MNRSAPHTRSLVPYDYRRALQKAIFWLGDRYLLAAPQPRTGEHPKYWTAPQHAAAYQLKQTRASLRSAVNRNDGASRDGVLRGRQKQDRGSDLLDFRP